MAMQAELDSLQEDGNMSAELHQQEVLDRLEKLEKVMMNGAKKASAVPKKAAAKPTKKKAVAKKVATKRTAKKAAKPKTRKAKEA